MKNDRSSHKWNGFWLRVGWASAILLLFLAAYAVHQVTSDMFDHLQDELVLTQASVMPR